MICNKYRLNIVFKLLHRVYCQDIPDFLLNFLFRLCLITLMHHRNRIFPSAIIIRGLVTLLRSSTINNSFEKLFPLAASGARLV